MRNFVGVGKSTGSTTSTSKKRRRTTTVVANVSTTKENSNASGDTSGASSSSSALAARRRSRTRIAEVLADVSNRSLDSGVDSTSLEIDEPDQNRWKGREERKSATVATEDEIWVFTSPEIKAVSAPSAIALKPQKSSMNHSNNPTENVTKVVSHRKAMDGNCLTRYPVLSNGKVANIVLTSLHSG